MSFRLRAWILVTGLLLGASCRDDAAASHPGVTVLGRWPLSFGDDETVPLSFYPSLDENPESGIIHLEAITGGIYPSGPGMIAVAPSGRVIASLSPLARWKGVPPHVSMLGRTGGMLVVSGRGLVDAEWAGASPHLAYCNDELKVLRAEQARTRGLLASDGFVYLGSPTIDADGSANCIQKFSVSGELLDSFGACPEGWGEHFVQQMAVAVEGSRVYWVHFREPRLHICTTTGQTVGEVTFSPEGYVDWAQAQAELGESAELRQLLETTTLIQAIVPIGNRVLLSFRARPKRKAEFWEFDNIIQVIDVVQLKPLRDVRLPWKLLGRNARGDVYWLESRSRGARPPDHVLVRTRVDTEMVPSPDAASD